MMCCWELWYACMYVCLKPHYIRLRQIYKQGVIVLYCIYNSVHPSIIYIGAQSSLLPSLKTCYIIVLVQLEISGPLFPLVKMSEEESCCSSFIHSHARSTSGVIPLVRFFFFSLVSLMIAKHWGAPFVSAAHKSLLLCENKHETIPCPLVMSRDLLINKELDDQSYRGDINTLTNGFLLQ